MTQLRCDCDVGMCTHRQNCRNKQPVSGEAGEPGEYVCKDDNGNPRHRPVSGDLREAVNRIIAEHFYEPSTFSGRDWRDAVKVVNAIFALPQFKAQAEALNVAAVLERVAAAQSADPATDDLTVTLAIEFAQAQQALIVAAKALEPFAAIAEGFDDDGRMLDDEDGVYANTAGDFRRARTALAKIKELRG